MKKSIFCVAVWGAMVSMNANADTGVCPTAQGQGEVIARKVINNGEVTSLIFCQVREDVGADHASQYGSVSVATLKRIQAGKSAQAVSIFQSRVGGKNPSDGQSGCVGDGGVFMPDASRSNAQFPNVDPPGICKFKDGSAIDAQVLAQGYGAHIEINSLIKSVQVSAQSNAPHAHQLIKAKTPAEPESSGTADHGHSNALDSN